MVVVVVVIVVVVAAAVNIYIYIYICSSYNKSHVYSSIPFHFIFSLLTNSVNRGQQWPEKQNRRVVLSHIHRTTWVSHNNPNLQTKQFLAVIIWWLPCDQSYTYKFKQKTVLNNWVFQLKAIDGTYKQVKKIISSLVTVAVLFLHPWQITWNKVDEIWVKKIYIYIAVMFWFHTSTGVYYMCRMESEHSWELVRPIAQCVVLKH